MQSEADPAVAWAGLSLRPHAPGSPRVVMLAGIDDSAIVDAALDDPAVAGVTMLRLEPGCAPPCDGLLWRLETACGDGLNEARVLDRHWHRPPYAMTMRLAQYQPGSVVPEILDEGTLGTLGSRAAFKISVDRLAMRFVRDAALGRGRGSARSEPASAPHGLPGWLDRWRARWQGRIAAASSGVGAGAFGRPAFGADAAAPAGGEDRCRGHSGPGGIFRDDAGIFYVQESRRRGDTRIFRLDDSGQAIAIGLPAPNSRLAAPVLFRWNSTYWLACTDLDLGEDNNLCLLHAADMAGPWTRHARWPVKIDIRGARPAGMPFASAGRLFRPGLDCAGWDRAGLDRAGLDCAAEASAIALYEIMALCETDFRERLVMVVRPKDAGRTPPGSRAPRRDHVIATPDTCIDDAADVRLGIQDIRHE